MTDNLTEMSDEGVPDESEQLDQLQGDDSLSGREVMDPLDEGYIPPDHWSPGEGFGNTAAEQAEGETLDQRIKQEVPDTGEESDREVSSDEVDDLAEENLDDAEVGDLRAGRLVDPGSGEGINAVGDVDTFDVEQEMIAQDVGIDGAAATAEEAAMHIVDEPGIGDS